MQKLRDKLLANSVLVNGPMETQCREWQLSKYPNGYGQVWYEGRLHSTHRASYTAFIAPIPNELFVLHKCDNRPCIKPEHLFLGKQLQNIHDMINKGRRSYIGSNSSVAVLTEEIVLRLRAEYNKGYSTIADIAVRNGINYSTAYNAIKANRWKHI